MNKEIYDEWIGQAAIREKDEVDALRKVLDPKDKKGDILSTSWEK